MGEAQDEGEGSSIRVRGTSEEERSTIMLAKCSQGNIGNHEVSEICTAYASGEEAWITSLATGAILLKANIQYTHTRLFRLFFIC